MQKKSKEIKKAYPSYKNILILRRKCKIRMNVEKIILIVKNILV